MGTKEKQPDYLDDVIKQIDQFRLDLAESGIEKRPNVYEFYSRLIKMQESYLKGINELVLSEKSLKPEALAEVAYYGLNVFREMVSNLDQLPKLKKYQEDKD